MHFYKYVLHESFGLWEPIRFFFKFTLNCIQETADAAKLINPMEKKLNRDQWYQLDEQMSRTPAEPGAEGEPGQHFQLIALLNKFGFTPNSKWEAIKLAEELLDEGWEETQA
jgi:hypothetical protein